MYTNRLRADKMAALKEKDTVKNKVITMLISGLTYKHKELGRDCTEDECLDVIRKELKQIREAIDMAKGREDAIAELNVEAAILESYLPKQMDSEEVAAAVKAIVEQAGVELTVKNKGQVMKAVMAELKGKADGKLIGTVVDSLLSE
ncbi:MAG: GatB/YqeY domain-containing protein [Peptococcaceae bacterium]|nr:GatB/YqeY domain-containing protein [Peptococcaceae bacterium]